MKILEIGTMDNKGGAARVSWELKIELEQQGHDVKMIVGYKKTQDKNVREIFDSPINNFISKIIKRNFSARLHNKLAYWISNDISFLPGKKIVKTKEFLEADIVHAHNLHDNFFSIKNLPAMSQIKPFIWTLHDMWPITGHNSHAFDCVHWQNGGCNCVLPDSIPPHRKNNSQKLWEMKKKIYGRSKLRIVVPSRWLGEKIKKSILKNHNLYLIYNGVDTDIFKPRDKKTIRQKLGLPYDKTIVLFASKGGSKNIWKGWEFAEIIIEKEKNNPKYLFVCLGGFEGDLPSKNIHPVSYITDKNLLADYYSASDMLLYPSIADNCPLTVIEAMSSGLPILTFQTGGIPELVEHKKTGYVAEYKNTEDLMKGFYYISSLDEKNKNIISRECRKQAEKKFSLKQMTQNYLRLYRSLI